MSFGMMMDGPVPSVVVGAVGCDVAVRDGIEGAAAEVAWYTVVVGSSK